jgi:DNA-binding NarL/FixJ family response regulator
MSDSPQYPAIVIAGADPVWLFELQQHLRAIVGWEYDLLLTFSPEQVLRYVAQRSVRLLISEQAFLRRAPGMSGAEVLRQARAQSPATQALLIYDGAPSPNAGETHGLERGASPEQIRATLSRILGLASSEQAA